MSRADSFSWWCRVRGHHIITLYTGPTWASGMHSRKGCCRCAHLFGENVRVKRVQP